jgi:hypothetical protein
LEITIMIELSTADTFFETHLEKSFWENLDETTRTACLAMAETDVLLRLGLDAVDVEQTGHLAAVCEQAVYLCRNRDQLSLPVNLASESIDGAGSRSYNANPANELFSPRAAAIIRRICGGNRLSRG